MIKHDYKIYLNKEYFVLFLHYVFEENLNFHLTYMKNNQHFLSLYIFYQVFHKVPFTIFLPVLFYLAHKFLFDNIHH